MHEVRKQRQTWRWRMKKKTSQKAGFTSSCCREVIMLLTLSLSAWTSGDSSPGWSLFWWVTALLRWILWAEEERWCHWESLPKRLGFTSLFPGQCQCSTLQNLFEFRELFHKLCLLIYWFMGGEKKKKNPTGMHEKIKASYRFFVISKYWLVPCSTHASDLFKEN